MIETARFADAEGSMVEAVIGGVTFMVPTDLGNRHYRALHAWVAQGNSIAPFAAPPPEPPPRDLAAELDALLVVLVDKKVVTKGEIEAASKPTMNEQTLLA